MAITVLDVEDLLNVLRQHPEWRERVRQENLTRLPQTVDRIDQRRAELMIIVDASPPPLKTTATASIESRAPERY